MKKITTNNKLERIANTLTADELFGKYNVSPEDREKYGNTAMKAIKTVAWSNLLTGVFLGAYYGYVGYSLYKAYKENKELNATDRPCEISVTSADDDEYVEIPNLGMVRKSTVLHMTR